MADKDKNQPLGEVVVAPEPVVAERPAAVRDYKSVLMSSEAWCYLTKDLDLDYQKGSVRGSPELGAEMTARIWSVGNQVLTANGFQVVERGWTVPLRLIVGG